MRSSPAFPYVLAAAGLVQAFPFVAGRSMEYSVIRRGGAEKSIVTLTPQGSLPGAAGGVEWKVSVVDSLVSGARKDAAVPAVKSSEIYLQVTDTYKAWTTNACEVPWDMEDPLTNQIPPPKSPWGMRALGCDGAAGGSVSVGGTSSGTRVTTDGQTCSSSSTTCLSYNNVEAIPSPAGLWSDDSGWISYQDGAIGESWVLKRIGGGGVLPDLRFRSGRKIKDVRKEDKWTFAKILDWRSVKFGVGKNDSTSGIDSTRIVWVALERIGTTGQVGTWKVRRDMSGHETGHDTIEVDFDSPLAMAEARQPSDVSASVFQKMAWPPIERSTTSHSFIWTDNSTGTAWNDAITLGRTYSYSEEGEFQKMEQTYSRRSQGYLVDPESDSNTTIELVEFARSLSSRVSGRDDAAPGCGTPRTLGELDRLVANGGRILSIRDVRGARLDGSAGTVSGASFGAKGMFLFEATSPEGLPLRGRVLRP